MTALFLELTPSDENTSWETRALCAQTDPEAYFPEKGGDAKTAKGQCRSCEVRAECLTAALDRDERFGIWGGFSERERRKLKHSPTALAAALADIAATTPTAPAITITPSQTRTETPMTDAMLDPQTTPTVGGVNATPTAVLHSGDEGPKDTQEAAFLSAAGAPAPPTSTTSRDEFHDDEETAEYELPDYIVEIALLLRDTEGHPDTRVRAARKAVVGTLQVLNKTYKALDPVAPHALDQVVADDPDVDEGARNRALLDRELQAVEKRGKRKPAATTAGKRTPPNNSLAIAARVAALGVTTRDIRTWAVDAGMDVPSRGALPVRVLDAYESAHTQAAS